MTTFTASEVRDWERAYKGTGAAKVFGAFADLLEAQEKAMPVAWFTDDHLADRSATTYDLSVAERWRTKGWPVTPLYSHPQPAQDAKDAARYRWLREHHDSTRPDWHVRTPTNDIPAIGGLDAAIDAAMTKESGQ